MGKYNIQAEYAPALLITMFLSLVFIYLKIDLSSVITALTQIKIETKLLNLSGSIVLWLLAVFFIRLFGKHFIENIIFKNGYEFPTTNMLLSNNTIKSTNFKNEIFKLLDKDKDFDANCLNSIDIKEERKIIHEQVGYIRVKVGDGKLVLSNLIRYGFARNFLGGLIITIPFYLFAAFQILYSSFVDKTFPSIFGVTIVAICLIVVILLLFREWIINRFAMEYAHKLFEEYQAMPR